MSEKIKICCGNKCSERGAVRMMEEIQDKIGSNQIEMTKCQDYCEDGPNVIYENKIYHSCRPKDIVDKLESGSGIPIKTIKIDDLPLDELI